MNCRDFLSLWIEYLSPAAEWLQISFLCGHTQWVGVRACQKALDRSLSYTPHNAVLNQRWIKCISRFMPCDKTTTTPPVGLVTAACHLGWSQVCFMAKTRRRRTHSSAVIGLCVDASECSCPLHGGGGRGSCECSNVLISVQESPRFRSAGWFSMCSTSDCHITDACFVEFIPIRLWLCAQKYDAYTVRVPCRLWRKAPRT